MLLGRFPREALTDLQPPAVVVMDARWLPEGAWAFRPVRARQRIGVRLVAVLSQTDLDWIRDWVGSTPSDDNLADFYDDLVSKEAVAWRILSRRRADFLASPSTVTIPGVVSRSNVSNIEALESTLNRLLPIAQAAGVDVGGLGGASSGKLQRPERCRESGALEVLSRSYR